MARVRRALRVGVGRAPEAEGVLGALEEAVSADLRLLDATLRASGYEVEVLADAGRNKIRLTIDRVAREVPSGGTLLVYFSGHGVRVGGKDYLVPADAIAPADGGWTELHLDSLLPANIGPLLRGCEAGTALWFIDACRTELDGDGERFANEAVNGPPQGGFAVMAGCSAGERSGFTSEGSFFTRGLAEALGPMTPARTVEDVLAAARAATVKAARRYGVRQTPWFLYGAEEEARARKTEICEGRALLEAWQGAVRETPLWEYVPSCERAALVGVLEEFVTECARGVHLAQERLPEVDPWVDDAFPVRVLRDRLPELLPDGVSLSIAEVIALVAAPFLHEAAWAERLSQAVEVRPYSVERRGGDAHRLHYEQIVEQHGRVARKVMGLQARGEDAGTLVMWLVHRWIEDRVQIDEVVPSPFAASLAGRLGLAAERAQEFAELLRVVASGVASDEPLDESWGARKVVLPVGGQQHQHQVVRVRALGALVRLAGVLAVDVRTLPDVVADHLAVSDPVLPQHVLGVVRELSWQRENSTLHLDALCPHQAVHAALAEVVEEADRFAGRVAGEGVLAAVPSRVTDRDLQPSRVGGRESYEVPLLRFHLAQTEVRDLLMGEQLYGGEPQLALRELYQNAMDACRYRGMRWRYLDSVGARPAAWSGRIEFTQGEDERGRYVECRDNGVGMSAEQLKQTFTRAGSRFERSTSFRREQSRWLRHDPELRLYPNSRFGIGVFSYFMLAEEMTIVTRVVSPEGIPAEHALRVEIPSSGSLFRVQRHDGVGDGMAEGGTRVRLYLRDEEGIRGVSCVEVLRELVWVSEFEVRAWDGGEREHVWEPGVLQRAGAVEGVPGALWWVSGEGSVLCDGIVTDQEPFGYVVNLTGPHAGQLSVSREELQAYDAKWVESLWRRGAQALASSPMLSCAWMWTLEKSSLATAQVLDSTWRGKGVQARGWTGNPVELDRVGWYFTDEDLTAKSTPRAEGDLPWRASAHGWSQRLNSTMVLPTDLTGYPVPVPGDAKLTEFFSVSWYSVVANAARLKRTPDYVQRRLRTLRIAHPALSPLPSQGDTISRVPDGAESSLAEHLADSRNASEVIGGAGSRHWGSLVTASLRMSVPLGKLVRQLAFHRSLLPSPLPEIPERHENHICTQDDVDRLFHHLSGGNFLLVDNPSGVCRVAKNRDIPESEVLQALADFSWLGWTPPSAKAVECLLGGNAVSDVLYEFAQWNAKVMPWAATVKFAHALGTDLSTAESQLAWTVEELGLSYTRRYMSGTEAGSVRPSEDTAKLVRRLRKLKAPLEEGITLKSLYLSFYREDAGIEDLALAVDELRQAGVDVPNDISLVFDWHSLPLHDRFLLSGAEASREKKDCPAHAVTSAVLVRSAERLNETLAQVWSSATEYGKRYGFAVPPLPKSLLEVRPSQNEIYALTNYDLNWKPLGPQELAHYAYRQVITPATAYARLLPFRPLGALIPTLTPGQLAALPTEVPTQHDLLALGDIHRLTQPPSPYTPLDLLSISARLGEPLPRTAARIAPYLPLTDSPTPLPPVPDLIPLWQDLSILTPYLNGLLPALEGQVTRDHIARAAQATDMTEDWVASRLALYAEMFALTLPLD
ncbi:caspase family protein [Streptomyces roseirectus]|uniref:Caspase family protein n=1 Tax=Streptomyces roseirectus TaxID=2768066 RepID=A0A7H0ILT3_9ACTN|nr:caspase family protein [Streptomyces roseirectus]QNP73749.1 caspase family protein [Streptomyces roseirectus]